MLFTFTIIASSLGHLEASNQLHLKGKVPEVLSVERQYDKNGVSKVTVKSNLAPEKNHKIRIIKERRPASISEVENLPEKITLEVQ